MTMFAYVLYLVISITLTVWVAHILSKNGLIFLIEYFGQKADLANSVNHMLVVGFYLVNVGFVTMTMSSNAILDTPIEVLEFLSKEIGMVLIVLGVMHFSNVYVISRWGRSMTLEKSW